MGIKNLITYYIEITILMVLLILLGVNINLIKSLTFHALNFATLAVIYDIRTITKFLDEKCDPINFIKAIEKNKPYAKTGNSFNLYKLNMSVGLACFGQYDEAISALQAINLPIKNNRILEILYHSNLMAYYTTKGDFLKAEYEYKNYVKAFRVKVSNPKTALSIDGDILLYQFLHNKNPETARHYLEQCAQLEKSYTKKICKRFKVEILYNKAIAELEIGNIENALEKFKTVAKHGNKLWIAKLARDKVEELEKNG